MLKASVLIVGDDPHLLRMQTELLCDYQVVTACSREAREAIWTYAFDLLIVGQTVPETSARSLLAQASKLQPQPKTLLICRQYRNGTSDLPCSIRSPQHTRLSSRLRSPDFWLAIRAKHWKSLALGRWFHDHPGKLQLVAAQ